MRHIALDTETTGLDPFSGHRIVEIGCVEMINHVRTGNYFHTYLNPQRDMPSEAEKIHGLSSDFLKDKPVFKHVARSFLEFIGDSPLVIHNAAFDLKFLNAELDVAHMPLIDYARATDTVLIARKKFPGSPANLDALCKRFNIDTTARIKHGALLDAELLADVFLELMGGRQASLVTLMVEEIVSVEGDIQLGFSGHTDIPIRHFPPSSEELADHRVMLDKLKSPIWLAE